MRKQLEASQWWPRERLDADRVQRLRAFLTEIGQRVPYYRTLFGQLGFDPAGVQSLDDLRRLPPLTKSVIRVQVDQLKAEGHGELTRYNTGGSSGRAARVLHGQGPQEP